MEEPYILVLLGDFCAQRGVVTTGAVDVRTDGGVPAIANLRAETLRAVVIGSLAVAITSRKDVIAFRRVHRRVVRGINHTLLLILNLVVRK
jgi:hypothetical protein